MRLTAITVILGFLVSVCSCGGGSERDARWEEIDRLCDSVPEKAVGILDTLDQTGLSERDLNRYRLLWIKSRDKAFIAHTTDTLILDVVDYYGRHRGEGLYTEALYYGGRVYSDLGDLPTALEFFQKSLDEIQDDDRHLNLKGTVMDQTGRLLQTLRLDSAAVSYLEKSLSINGGFKEKIPDNAFTHGLMATSLRRMDRIREARKHIDAAVMLSDGLDESDRQTIQCELADMLLHEDKVDSALIAIRPLPSSVDSITLPYCLGVAAEVYKEVGILDTAYLYARQLTRLSTPDNKTVGYRVIFSNRMSDYVHKDTLLKLMPEYKQTIEDYLSNSEADQAIMQNTRYNYSLHEKQRLETADKLRSLQTTILIALGCITIMLLSVISVLLWRKYHKSKRDSQVLEGMMLSERLKEKPSLYTMDGDVEHEHKTDATIPFQDKTKILDEIRWEREKNPADAVQDSIKASSIYKDLMEKAENRKVMGKDISWINIEDLIEAASPGFVSRLTILTEGHITPAERKVALLMKCGFSQVQIASLLAKSESTISAQRKSLASKIGFDKSAIAPLIVRL